MITVHASRTSPSFDKAASEDSLSLAEGSDNTEGLLRPEVPSTFLDEPCDFDAFLNLSREVSGAREVAGDSSEEVLLSEVLHAASTFLDEPTLSACAALFFFITSAAVIRVGSREVSGAREVAGESSEEVLLSEVLHAASTFLDEPTLSACAALFFFITSAAAVLRVGSREVSGAREVAGESSEVLRGSIGKMAFAAFTCSPDGVRFRRCGNAARDAGGVAGVADAASDAASDAAVRSIRPEPTVPGTGGRAGAGISFAAL